ncbi:MAG: hypothetical protein J7L25_03355 [Deltaproteobacteria bacterium]|nr:hypothetical protein [Candidatus Tharpella aukensis]
MYAERLILKTNTVGEIENIPPLPANKKLEAIFLIIDDITTQPAKRTPHVKIAGKMKIIGNLLDTAPVTDWDFPQ